MTATLSATALSIREYRVSDRSRVREIACRTAFRNRGHSALIDDASLFADYWTRYYTDLEPESAIVAERDGVVVGYCLGCLDTKRFQRAMARIVAPPIFRSLLWRFASGHYRRDAHMRRVVRWLALRSWRESPPVDLDRFPAHYHLNLLREGYGVGAYTEMALHFANRAMQGGAPGMHGQVLDRRDGGVWQGMVREFAAAHPHMRFVATSRPSSLAAELLNDERPMMNRAFAGDVSTYATFLNWVRKWRRL